MYQVTMCGEKMKSTGASAACEKECLNIVDLFSGVGGFSLGAARAGFVVRGAVDIDPKANDAHTRNFPHTLHLDADVAELTGSALRAGLELNDWEPIAGIVGGPPCQGFSTMGTRDKNDKRNGLFVEFFRIVSEVRPLFYLVENVPGIMRDDFSEVRKQALSFTKTEYKVLPPMHMSANDFGAATNRTRVFFFGYLPEVIRCLTTKSFQPPRDVEKAFVRDALYGLPIEIDPNWQSEEDGWRAVNCYKNDDFAKKLREQVPPGVGDKTALSRLSCSNEVSGFLGTAHTKRVAERYANTEQGRYDSISKAYRLDPDGFCPTLRAGTGPEQGSFQAVRPIHPTEARVITPREAARLQGFPDWFQFSPTKWHSFRQIGNSVSPILAERILSVISKSMNVAKPVEKK